MARFNASRPLENDSTSGCRSPDTVLIVDSAEILRGHQEVMIRHGEEFYRLRVTKAGKLYLTK